MIKELKSYFKNKKSILLVYLVLLFIVLIFFSLSLINKSWNDTGYCLLALTLFLVPFSIAKIFKIKIPDLLETIFLLFVFAVTILGGINNFYIIFSVFDKILHTVHGFCCCALGLGLIEMMIKTNISKSIVIFKVFLALCFSMTIGIFWEFFEFSCDLSFKSDMQKDTFVSTMKSVALDATKENTVIVLDDIKKVEITYSNNKKEKLKGYLDIGLIDTIGDLIVNFIGALTFSFLAYFYLNNKHFRFVKKLLITKLN